MPSHDEIVRFFSKHMIPVFFKFQKGDKIRETHYTTFVLSVSNRWFLVTAGHCMQEIADGLNAGYTICNCMLGVGSPEAKAISFPYEYTKRNHEYDEDTGVDYGFIELPPDFKRELENYDIQALTEQVWKWQPSVTDFYYLLGISADFVEFNRDTIYTTPTFHPIQENQRPEESPEIELPLFYGVVALGEEMQSIRGMSGGPIFAFHRDNKGQFRYTLKAIQSKWIREKRLIKAYPIALLRKNIERLVQGDTTMKIQRTK